MSLCVSTWIGESYHSLSTSVLPTVWAGYMLSQHVHFRISCGLPAVCLLETSVVLSGSSNQECRLTDLSLVPQNH